MANRDELVQADLIMDSGHPSFILARFGWEISEQRNCYGFEAGWRSLGCAMTGWHIHEWFWKLSDWDARERIGRCIGVRNLRSMKQFGLEMQKQEPAIAVCRQIGTVAKHLSVHKPWEGIKSTFHLGDGKDGDPDGYFVQIWIGEMAFRDVEVYSAAFSAWVDLYCDAKLRDWERVTEGVAHLRNSA